MGGDSDHPASAIITAFGGIRPMASKLDVPVSTVQGWKQRDSIPDGRMAAIRAAAAAAGIDLPEPESVPAPVSETTESRSPSAETATEPEPPAEPPAAVEEPAPATETPRRGGGLAVLALVISLAAAGWIWWTTAGPGAGGGENARISALEGRVARLGEATSGDGGKTARDAISRDLEALRAEVRALAPADSPDIESLLAPLREQIAGLRVEIERLGDPAAASDAAIPEARLQALDDEIQNAVQLASTNMQAMSGVILEFDTKLKELADRLDALAPRLEALEKVRTGDTAAVTEAVALALASGQLRQALESGASYRAPLDLVGSLGADDPALTDALAALDGHANAGVSTLPALRAEFAEQVPVALAGGDAADGDLLERLESRARELVRIRRIGADVPGQSAEANVARAEAALAGGDVQAALREIAALEAFASDAFAPWVARAEAHVVAHDALETIETQALERLQAEGETR